MLIILCLIVGITFLIAGSKIMLEGIKDIGARYNYSSLTIGITLVAFGTSIPELLVSLKAMSLGYSDIVIFNVIGSNIINILLILGICSIKNTLKITSNTIKKELPLTICATLLFIFLSLDDLYKVKADNIITRYDALILIIFFFIYLALMAKNILKKEDSEYYYKPRYSLSYSIIISVIGFLMIFAGSVFTVDMAYELSNLGANLKLISVGLIAFSTSIPELTTCMHLIKQKKDDMVIANILGSNIFNICIVLGIPIIIYGSLNVNSMSIVDIVNFILAAIILYIFAPIRTKIGKFEGIIMIFTLLIYYGFILWEGLGL